MHLVMYFVSEGKCSEIRTCTNAQAVVNHIASWTRGMKEKAGKIDGKKAWSRHVDRQVRTDTKCEDLCVMLMPTRKHSLQKADSTKSREDDILRQSSSSMLVSCAHV